MSDHEVLAALETMERRLDGDPGSLDAAMVEAWNLEFQRAVATAERGEDWPAILDRAHRLAQRVQMTAIGLDRQRQELKAQILAQGLGERALKAYGPSN